MASCVRGRPAGTLPARRRDGRRVAESVTSDHHAVISRTLSLALAGPGSAAAFLRRPRHPHDGRHEHHARHPLPLAPAAGPSTAPLVGRLHDPPPRRVEGPRPVPGLRRRRRRRPDARHDLGRGDRSRRRRSTPAIPTATPTCGPPICSTSTRRPTMVFRSTSIADGRDGWVLDGELTIGDVTRPQRLDLEFGGIEQFPRWPSPRRLRGDRRAAAQGLRDRPRHAARRQRRRPRRRRQDRARHPAARAGSKPL